MQAVVQAWTQVKSATRSLASHCAAHASILGGAYSRLTPGEARWSIVAGLAALGAMITLVAFIDTARASDRSTTLALGGTLVFFLLSEVAAGLMLARAETQIDSSELRRRLAATGPQGEARSSHRRDLLALFELRHGALRDAALSLPVIAAIAAGAIILQAPLILAPLLVAALWLVSRPAPTATAEAKEGASGGEGLAGECAANIELVRSAAIGPAMIRRFEQWTSGLRTVLAREALPAGVSPLAPAALAATAAILAATAGASAGVIVAGVFAALKLSDPLLKAVLSLRQVGALRRAVAEGPPAPAPRRAAKPTLMVDLAWRDGARLCFSAPHGAFIGLSAADGARASAALRRVAGLPEAIEGRVFLDGRAVFIDDLDGPSDIVLVGPLAPLFDGTVLDNLTLFGAASEASALAACDLFSLRSAIDRLPAGLRTRVGADGAGDLSTSLQHCIGLARAVALSPRILLLDEPQALLDQNGDKHMMAALRSLKGRCTIIMASARRSYLALADAVHSLDAPPQKQRASG